METQNNQTNDLLSILTLSVGIMSGVFVLLVGALAGIIGILGIILAFIAKRQDQFNRKYIKVGEIISWISTGLFFFLFFNIIFGAVF